MSRGYCKEMRGIWDMGPDQKLDSRRSYEAIFSGMPLKHHQIVLMVLKQEFSTTSTTLFIPLGKAS